MEWGLVEFWKVEMRKKWGEISLFHYFNIPFCSFIQLATSAIFPASSTFPQ
jgi:hypothetical protein